MGMIATILNYANVWQIVIPLAGVWLILLASSIKDWVRRDKVSPPDSTVVDNRRNGR